MKGISLHEPWATAMRFGLKQIETRDWPLKFYRGEMAICAAKTTIYANEIFNPVLRPFFESVGITKVEQLSFGCIVARGRLANVYKTEELNVIAQERAFGNYDAGRFGWWYEELVGLVTPIPWRGSQGIFEVPYKAFTGAQYLEPGARCAP